MLAAPWALKLEIHSPPNFVIEKFIFKGLPAVGRVETSKLGAGL
jgi:hypothetical protein